MSYLCDSALLRLTINRDWRTGQLGYGYYCGLGPDLEKAKSETTPDTRREGKESAHSCAGIVPKDDLDECCLGHDNCWARITELFSNMTKPGWQTPYKYEFEGDGAV